MNPVVVTVNPAITAAAWEDVSMDERYEAISSSALFVGVGLLLILVGGLVDPVHHLF